jgi:hypothetical protein
MDQIRVLQLQPIYRCPNVSTYSCVKTRKCILISLLLPIFFSIRRSCIQREHFTTMYDAFYFHLASTVQICMLLFLNRSGTPEDVYLYSQVRGIRKTIEKNTVTPFLQPT